MWRMSTAAIALPSTNAGIIVVASDWRQSSNGLTKPEAGSQPSFTENRKISMMPSQKFGMDRPQSANTLAP